MDVSPERVAELQREGSIQLIDIREPYEWEAGRIPGARFLTMGELTAQAETIHRETPVVFYCRVGDARRWPPTRSGARAMTRTR